MITSHSSITLPPLSDIRASLLRDEHRQDPSKWIKDKLGEELWSKQVEILNLIRDNRRTAIYSCHRIGKSFIGGRLAFWWLDTHKPGEALVVTSAHSSAQVKMALWREMSRVHTKGKFPGRMNQVEYWIPVEGGKEEMVAFGRKPSDEDPSAFQGTYSKFVLFILDEACYVPKPLWEGADTLIGNEFSKIVAFGNPDDPNTEFAEVCKPGSGWKSLSIGYADTPNFSGERVSSGVKEMLIGPTWVEEKKKKWGEDNPLYISKVLGQFPEITTDGLIPMQWIRAAQERTLTPIPGCENELGVDVGGGTNKSVVCHRLGSIFRIIRRDHNPDTMQTLGNVMYDILTTGATVTRIDSIGIGWGMVDRASEMSKDKTIPVGVRQRAQSITGIKVGEASNDSENYANLRAEGCWGLRERFQDGDIDIDPDDDDLAAQLAAVKYKRTSRGQILIESKEDMRKRGMPSPDDFDALMLSQLKVKGKDRPKKATWGKRSKDRNRDRGRR